MLSDINHGTYKKLVIAGGRLTGAVLIGDVGDALWYLELIRDAAADAKNSRRHDVRPLARASVQKLHDPVAAMTAIDPDLRAISTTCAYCGVGCGILATPDGRGGAAISGDPEHPANFGRLCSKGSALGETLGLTDRLLYPMIRCGKGTMERVAWSDALDHVAHRFQHIIARDGPGAVAFYLSGQLLTEDYYVANKLMKGFIGSANVDTNSRLCMASSVAGHRRAFGADTVPGCYEDLDEADLLVLVGSNAAWCHPVLYQRMLANKQKRGARMIVIDPRRTDTVGDDDLFLGLKPGTDTALFSGLLVHLADNGVLDRDYIALHTTGFDDAMRPRAQASRAASAPPRWQPAWPSRTSRHSSRCLPTRARGHDVFAGRQPVGAGHRQGQRHRQLPPRDGADRQAGRIAVLADRAAQCDGRPRGRRARQPARRPHGVLRRRTSIACAGSGRRRASPPMKG